MGPIEEALRKGFDFLSVSGQWCRHAYMKKTYADDDDGTLSACSVGGVYVGVFGVAQAAAQWGLEFTEPFHMPTREQTALLAACTDALHAQAPTVAREMKISPGDAGGFCAQDVNDMLGREPSLRMYELAIKDASDKGV